ncbi:hypothetical protein [Actinomadura oligospora]|uniref:hypothetical protein n=1 Tax=Actinomadura oligospora TaxID=111804 RepID=UPI00047AFFB5|nr:hypothetical protein [Actinomadura oligospora]
MPTTTLMPVTVTRPPGPCAEPQRRAEFEEVIKTIAGIEPTVRESSRTQFSLTVVLTDARTATLELVLARLKEAFPGWHACGHWPIRTVLAVTHGYPVELAPYRDLLTAMTRQPIDVVTGVRAQLTCRPVILDQHPLLTVITTAPAYSTTTGDYREVDEWASRVEQLIGPTLPVAPLAPGQWEQRGLVEEVLDHAPPTKVWTLDPDDLRQNPPESESQ